ncbi:MAG: pyruvate, phosphate dikinase [bacterium]
MAKKTGKYVYFFGGGKADGTGAMKDLLGGKGAGIAEMTNAGVNVPPGFTITTEVCKVFSRTGRVPEEVDREIIKNLEKVEKLTGKRFGDPLNPLLVSVRSGAKFSMPGMMDTVLNLGLNDETVEGLARKTGNPRFALDARRRFIQMFGKVVLGVDPELFENALSQMKKKRGVALDTELDETALRELVAAFRETVRKHTGKNFPDDPMTQLKMARDAVFKSWNNPRAVTYRKLNDIPGDLGTAVNVQAMVFGNMGVNSGTGVGFTRNPATGENAFYGEYLLNAQGEDVVAGIRTPKGISELGKDMPDVYAELRKTTSMLEKHYRDIQDFEFTIEEGRLYMLQTRAGKRTGPAAVKIAVDMVREGLISKEEAVHRVDPASLDQLLHPVFDPVQRAKFSGAARGLPASPGAACGQVVFTADDSVRAARQGRKVILIRMETSPDDIHGMHVSEGILTATGGMTSHAAVVGRQMGTPCVVGCSALKINESEKTFAVGGRTVAEGDFISIDGTTGDVILAKVPTVPSEIIRVVCGEMKPSQSRVYRDFETLLKWADSLRRLGVRANADVPTDAATAVAFGAEGIGLCRTEHMFFGEGRIPIVQEMILAENADERRASLEKLLPMQRRDFIGIFEEMGGRPVTIRLLDPPLHEFLPRREELMVEILKLETKNPKSKKLPAMRRLLNRVNELHEFNPMLGLRGCRLGLTMPEVTEMQVRAIMEAACHLAKRRKKVRPEIMIPLTGTLAEMRESRKIVDYVAGEVLKEQGVRVAYLVGTMIEVPRAALTADEIASEAQFFSFGTNDLTQMTFGYSRDDAGKFIRAYLEGGILEKDPFQTLDQTGVGRLIRQAVEFGRGARRDLKIGICGEHGGDPASIEFCHVAGFDYVSCSPFRVPTARLAAAHAAIKHEISKKKKGDFFKDR